MQNFTFGKGIDERARDDVQQELNRRLRMGLGREFGNRLGVDRREVGVEAGARLHDIGDDQADRQRKRRHHFKVQQSLAADATDFLDVVHAGDAGHDGAKDDWCDDHLDQLDEAITERLHGDCIEWRKQPEQDAAGNRKQYLDIQYFIKWFFHHASP